MMETTLEKQLSALFREAGMAHHQAFIAVNGEDAEWHAWYADFLYERLLALVPVDIERDDLADLLALMEKTRQARDWRAYWPDFYARFFLGKFALSV